MRLQSYVQLWLTAFLAFTFTIAKSQAPTITSFNPISGPVGSLVTITGTNLSNPTNVSIGGVAAILVSSSATEVKAMVMPGAMSGPVEIANNNGTSNNLNSFEIEAPGFPSVRYNDVLVGQGAIGQSYQGRSVSISADGNTAVVTGFLDNNGEGGAWVFTRSNGIWSQQGVKLLGSGGSHPNIQQGSSSAISADGNTIALGSIVDGIGVGAVWVFSKNGGTWVQQGNKLIGTGALGSATQGAALSLSANGNTLLVGGYADDNYIGAAWIFERSNGVWTQSGNKLVGSNYVGTSYQGAYVSLSADGNTAIVGGAQDNGGVGAVWVFVRSGNQWIQQGTKLVGTGAIGNANQSRVALNADGNTLIIGGPADNFGFGAIWIFSRSGTVWNQVGSKITCTGNSGNATFGSSVSINALGTVAAVAGVNDNSEVGSIWIFRKINNLWIQEGNKLVGAGNGAPGPAPQQGVSIALSADASTVIVGGWRHNNMVGGAWVFEQKTSPFINDIYPTSGSIGSLITITGNNLKNITSVEISGVNALPISNSGKKLVVMVMPGSTNGNLTINSSEGAINIVPNFTIENTNNFTFLQNTKVANGSSIATKFGANVAVSADGTTAVISEPDFNNNQGAVNVYVKVNGLWTQQGNKLIGTNVFGDYNPTIPVAISADGNTVVFSRWRDNNGVGATWIFTRINGNWIQQGDKIIGLNANGNAEQGRSIALSADGNTLVLGGHLDNNSIGAVWVFNRNGNAWTQTGAKLVATDIIGGPRLGTSVAISADGKTLVVGGPSDDGIGAIWVFAKSVNGWSQAGNKLIGSGMSGGNSQGVSVAINADGTVLAFGSPFDGTGTGASWVFTKSNGIWSQDGNKLVGSGVAVGTVVQGQSISINAEGSKLMIGGPSDNNAIGATWVFIKTNGTWIQQGNKITGNGFLGTPYQGSSVCLSSDGKSAIFGGQGDNSSFGAFWSLNVSLPPSISSVSPLQGSIGTLIRIAGSNLGGIGAPSINGVQTQIISQFDDLLTVMVMPGTNSGSIILEGYPNLGTFTIIPTQVPLNQDGGNLAPIFTLVSGVPTRAELNSSVGISADGKRALIGVQNFPNFHEAFSFKRTNNEWFGERFTQSDPSLMFSIGSNKSKVAVNADMSKIAVLTGLRIANYNFRAGIWEKDFSIGDGSGNGMLFPDPNQTISLTANGKSNLVTFYNFTLQSASAGFQKKIGSGINNPSVIVNTIYGSPHWTPSEKAPRAEISSDGLTTIIGTPDINNGNGGVRIYQYQNSNWDFVSGVLTPSDAVGISKFGTSVAISADGLTAVVSGTTDNFYTGAVWVFKQSGGLWSQVGNKIVANDLVGPGLFGSSIAINASGDLIMVSAPNDDNQKGAFWFFKLVNGSWQQQGSKKRVVDADFTITNLGSSIALSSDASAAIITGISSRTVGQSVWMLSSVSAPIVNTFTPSVGNTGTTITINGSGFTGATSLKIGSAYPASWNVIDDNTISAVIGNGATGPIIVTNSNNIVGFSNTNFTYVGSGVPGGGTGGLESKSLGDAIGKRIINNAVSNKSSVIDYNTLTTIDENGQTYKAASTGASLTLAQILPKKISNGDYKAYTSTPTDIPSFTNAMEALSIDFTLQNKARAVAFGTKTLGGVYDHTKAVCDRLKGAELLKIENVQVQGINLVKFDLINARGQKEYAYSFVIGSKNGRNDYTIQSTWLNKNYSPDEVMFNIQLWAETPGLINDMANDIIYRLGQGMPVREITKSEALPVTYITKGKRESDHIVLDIKNATIKTNGYFEVQERANEQSNNLVKKQVPFTIAQNGNSTIKLPVGDLYESTISLFINGKMEDQVFMADGNWGTELTTNNTSIKSFKITNNTKPFVDSLGEFKLFRNVQLEANSQDDITVYKLLRGGGAPQDLSDYKTFKFTAAGSGANLKIILLRDSISNWADQYSLTIPLNSKITEYKLNLEEFKSKSIGSKINPNDLTTVIFIYEALNRGGGSMINAELSNLSFTKTDYAYINSLNSREINIYPNPASRKFFATFKSPKEASLNVVVRDATSGRVVFSKWVNAVKGENRVPVEIQNSVGLSNFILNIEGSDIKYQSKKVIITQ